MTLSYAVVTLSSVDYSIEVRDQANSRSRVDSRSKVRSDGCDGRAARPQNSADSLATIYCSLEGYCLHAIAASAPLSFHASSKSRGVSLWLQLYYFHWL